MSPRTLACYRHRPSCKLLHRRIGAHDVCISRSAAASPRVHVLTAYATGSGAPSRESIDPGVRNGYFTGALLHHLAASGQSLGVRRLLERVRESVLEGLEAASSSTQASSGGVQMPEVRDGLPPGDVYMVPTAVHGGASRG